MAVGIMDTRLEAGKIVARALRALIVLYGVAVLTAALAAPCTSTMRNLQA